MKYKLKDFGAYKLHLIKTKSLKQLHLEYLLEDQ